MPEILEIDTKIKKHTYLFIIAIMAFTGFEFFYRASFFLIPIISYAFFIFVREKYRFNNNTLIVLIVAFLTLLQTFSGLNETLVIFFLTVGYFYGYFLIAEIIKLSFIEAYVKIIFIISIISLFFFFITYNEELLDFILANFAKYFIPLNFKSDDVALMNESGNILIYNFMDYGFSYNRNSGPFWEPGMFAVFLNIALFLNTIRFKKLFSSINIIIFITIITTFSTTGYLAMFFICITYNLFYSSSKIKFLYIFILLLSSGFIFELDFMQDKIAGQISSANDDNSSRFGAILVHFEVMKDYPFLGVGEGISKYVSMYTHSESTSNGISLVFVKYGIPFGILYYYLLFKSCKNIIQHIIQKHDLSLSYCFFLLLLILSFSQDITIRHFYFFMIFWGLSLSVYNRNNIYEKTLVYG